jgi:hypothetical protein
MAARAVSRKKTSVRSKKARRYRCPNPDPPFCLQAIVKKILKDKAFAKFIADQLCKAHQGDIQAAKCVDSYFEPSDDELDALCIPESRRHRLLKCRCTDNQKLLLIDVVAHGVAGAKKI